MYLNIPTYKKGEWSHTKFETREEYLKFLLGLFKEPGKYNFDETSFAFNLQARFFNEYGVFTKTAPNTKDYIEYWETEKEKNRKGVIFIGDNDTWYIPRDYYMLLNFLPIYNKEKKDFTFADVRDAQYHMALYNEIALHSFKHSAILKKRQVLSSYYHCAKIINYFWFEKGFITKLAGSLKDYVNEKGIWRFLDEYRNWLNKHTAWYRNCQPDKVLNWEQKLEISRNGKKEDVGLKSTIIGLVLDKDPTNGVGGATGLFYHEEAGIAPKMNTTLEYLLPALGSGMECTGQFISAGSVGDLKQCEPLKELIYNPKSKDVLAVETNLLDEEGTIGMCGLFIPEQWSMKPYIDKYGNSLVEEALVAIKAQREEWKKDLNPEDYQLRISQHPINIKEAFAYRQESIFPQALITKQIRRIEDKEYFIEYVDLQRQEDGKIAPIKTNKIPISEFPLSMKAVDKEGAICVHERPCENPTFGMYYGSIDPVSEGRTVTSNSLCSILIYKNRQQIKTIKQDETIEHSIEQGKLVCSWTGRFDDINKTHERLSLIIEWYNAWTLIENNVSLFIHYMVSKRRQRYLVPRTQMLFLKELTSDSNALQEYGWRNTGTLFKTVLLSYGIEFLKEEINCQTDINGNILKTTYGIERIFDIMILKEMQAYKDGLNVDRLVSYCALVAFVAIQESSRGCPEKIVREDKNFDKSNKITNFNRSPFKHIGGKNSLDQYKKVSQPFKTLR